jgi:putative transposase
MSTYRYIAQRRGQLPVRQLCQVLRLSASAYYTWQRRQAPAPEPAWQIAVRAEFRWHVARYGTRRLRAELHA